MQFGKSKGGWSRRDKRVRARNSVKRPRALLGAEMLEPRQLLAAASINPAPTFTVQEQADFSNQLVATINDPAAATSDYTATINWGDGTSASAGTVVGTGQSGVFNVVGSHSFADEGSDTVRVAVSKDGGAPSSVLETVTVSDVPLGPASGGYTINAVEGTSPGNQPLALFNDPAPELTAPLPYSATIDWGDGSVTAGTVTYQPALSEFQVTGGGDHIYSTFGTKTVTVTLAHDAVPNITVTDTAIITDPPVVAQGGFTYTANEGATPLPQTLATFTDPGGALPVSHYSATIQWGDGNTTAGTVQAVGNQFSVLGSHPYAEEGTGAIAVVIVHDGNSTVTAVSSYSIADPPVRLTGATLSTTEGSVLSAAVATFIDPGGSEDVGDFSAQINWGDGTVSPGTITLSAANGVYTVAGSHVYLGAGNEQITVTVQHDVAPNATVISTASVSDVPLVGTSGPTFQAVEGNLSSSQVLATFTDPGVVESLSTPGAYGATIDWGDGTSATAGTLTFDGKSQIFTVSGQHTYVEDGIYPLTITLSHDQAANVTVSGTAAVSDPAVDATGGATFTGLEYRTSDLQTMAAFSDPGGGEPVGDYSATINWGDGTVSSGQIISNLSDTTYSVLGTHVYATFGTHAPTVTIFHDQAPAVTVQDSAMIGVPPIQASALAASWREFTVPVELSPLARLSFTDTEMTATISWGDGATSAGVITPDMLGSSGTVRGSHTYTEAGNYTITVFVSDGTQSVTQLIPTTVFRELLPLPNPDAATPNNYYVAEVYGDILHRQVDARALTVWSNLLDEGLPRVAVSNALVNSAEYLGNFVVNPAYEKYLGRAADPDGLQFWIAKMQQGLTDSMLVASLASSQEFYARAGGNTLGYVDAMYEKVLGRTADTAGEDFWIKQLNAGANPFYVALDFYTSGENFTDLVFNDYETLLDRIPTAAELNGAVNALTTGAATNEALIASIAATDEYFAMSQNE